MSYFLKRITSKEILDRFETMCEQRADLQTLRYILGPNKILEWIHSIGVCNDNCLKDLIPPIPPLELRSIVAAPEAEIFLWSGAVDMAQFIELYDQYRSPSDPEHPTILDFGCGCGRMTRFLNNCNDKWKSYASDINSELVNWCKKNLPGIQTYRNNARPPLPFKNQSFNLVFSLSIFTHLPEQLANLWLPEIYRVLAPNGILILTTHGHMALETIRESKAHLDMFKMKREEVLDILMNFEKMPFKFMSYSLYDINRANAGEEYGNSFIHQDYIKNKWNNKQFKVLQYLAGGLRGWQDIIVLQRRG